MYKIFLMLLVILCTQSCGTGNSKSMDRAQTIKAAFQAAGTCLEAAVLPDKDSAEAARRVTKEHLETYNSFNEGECTADDLKNALNVVSCMKTELCSLPPNSADLTVYMKAWPKCRINNKNPYGLSLSCAQIIKKASPRGTTTTSDNID